MKCNNRLGNQAEMSTGVKLLISLVCDIVKKVIISTVKISHYMIKQKTISTLTCINILDINTQMSKISVS